MKILGLILRRKRCLIDMMMVDVCISVLEDDLIDVIIGSRVDTYLVLYAFQLRKRRDILCRIMLWFLIFKAYSTIALPIMEPLDIRGQNG